MTRCLEIREMTRDELDEVSGGSSEAIISPGGFSLGVSDSGTDATRTVTMFLRRVWRDGAL
jgi:hypothetical protein